MVEMLALKTDSEQGYASAQHNIDDQELNEAFENLYLDEENVSRD